MAVLAILLAVRQHTGSFAAAGIASGSFGFANVLAAPWRARAIDRWGQRRTLGPLGISQAVGYLGLALAAEIEATPVAVLVGLSVMSGLAAPPLGAAMRTIWSSITTPGNQRARALSLDAIADEVVFIAGPVLAASLSTAFSPSAALLAATIALLGGTLGLTSSQVSGKLGGRAHEPLQQGPPPLRRLGFGRVLVVLFGVGSVLGAVEVVAPAVAVGDDQPAASGWLLAALSIGSALGGVVYGHVSWRSPLGSRLVIPAATMGALTCGTAFATSVPLFAIGAVLIGFFLAPAIVTGYLAAEHLVPSYAATEASVWTNTALNLGAALANVGAGALVTASGTTAAMLLAGAVVLAASVATPRARLG